MKILFSGCPEVGKVEQCTCSQGSSNLLRERTCKHILLSVIHASIDMSKEEGFNSFWVSQGISHCKDGA